jgi:hypothetical protein
VWGAVDRLFTSKIMLPFGGLLMALFVRLRGSESNSHLRKKLLRSLANIGFILLKIFSPILLIIIFVKGII